MPALTIQSTGRWQRDNNKGINFKSHYRGGTYTQCCSCYATHQDVFLMGRSTVNKVLLGAGQHEMQQDAFSILLGAPKQTSGGNWDRL